MMSHFSPSVRSTSASLIRFLDSSFRSSPSESRMKLKKWRAGIGLVVGVLLSERDFWREEIRSGMDSVIVGAVDVASAEVG